MAGIGFKDRNVAEKLKAMAGKVPVSQRDGQSTSQQVNYPITPDELILIAPKDGIPARDGSTMYSAICCVYDCPENYLTDTVDLSQSCNWRLCYNDFDTAIAPYTVFVARLRKYGHFVIDRILYVDRTTTTTPPTGSGGLLCQGSCKFIWSASTQAWTKTLDTCAASTTTTTTSPYTSSTTTTTTTTCACEAGLEPSTITTSTTTSTTTSLGQTTTTTTTTSTTTTTTTTASCVCSNPDFCGTVNGQCVYTNCIPSTLENEVHYCSSTSTTSTSSTTTTSYDCATTTTAAGCSIGCDYTWVTSWVQTLDGCSPQCPCTAPSYLGSNCVDVHTSCAPVIVTTTTPPGTCGGTCCWWCHPTVGWIFDGVQEPEYGGCTGCWWDGPVPANMSSHSCRCPKPTTICNVCGDRTTTACTIDGLLTSSTTTTTSTTVHPCYTSSTSTSTTTTNLCATSRCVWIVNPSPPPYWIWSSGGCPSSCPCSTPTMVPIDACQVVRTVCEPSTSTTTTTTSSTTTSTSTTCPAAGSCLYACQEAGWVAVCDCTAPDFCAQCYAEPCTPALYGTIVVCTCGTTTTTTSTTTSTTTTCGYCSWGCTFGGGWYLITGSCPGACGGCGTPPPMVSPCPSGGAGLNTLCAAFTTTTSSTTTSSTTTTTTTTGGPSSTSSTTSSTTTSGTSST